LKQLSDDEARTVRRELMREAGWTPGSGPPSAEVIQKVRELAKARGIELPAWGGPGGAGARSAPGTPVTRVVYRLVGNGPAAHAEAVNVKLGISDGTSTEVIEGLAEGDRIITNAYTASADASSAPRSGNPLGGGPRRF
jgi:HlyD family secretion protein